jgi:TrmH family RNA methyltransferase
MMSIASRENPHYKTLKKLCQSSRERRRSARVLLDGMHLIEAYGRHRGIPEEIVVSDSGARRPEAARYLANCVAGTRVTCLSDALFDDLAVVDTPSGIMAIVAWPQPARPLDHGADTVLLDGVQDPGNVGSILRSTAAAGFRQVLLSADCAQAWSPKTLRAAMGAHFQVVIHEGGDLAGFLAAYPRAGGGHRAGGVYQSLCGQSRSTTGVGLRQRRAGRAAGSAGRDAAAIAHPDAGRNGIPQCRCGRCHLPFRDRQATLRGLNTCGQRLAPGRRNAQLESVVSEAIARYHAPVSCTPGLAGKLAHCPSARPRRAVFLTPWQ